MLWENHTLLYGAAGLLVVLILFLAFQILMLRNQLSRLSKK